MRRILLISRGVLHYREAVYNYFSEEFRAEGLDFHVASDSFQDVYDHAFETHRMRSLGEWRTVIEQVRPDVVVMFLHLRDKIMPALIRYCRRHQIKIIYWNHGVNIADSDNRLKNAAFHWIHARCDALITYTPDMRRFFKPDVQDRVFVAYNTLNLSNVAMDALDRKETRSKYGMTEDKIVLYASRFQSYKQAELLVSVFEDAPGVGVVFVGPDAPVALKDRISALPNMYYLGELYGAEIDAVYNAADVFSTPGHIGLALNQALFWGLPVMLLEGHHAPEIYYMRNGDTGFIASTVELFREKALALLADDEEIHRMSVCCRKVYAEQIGIDKMYAGFRDAIVSCLH